MRPIFHPSLVNGRYGDPTVYVETLFKTHSVLFDLGEIASLSPRKIRRVDQIFVSHAHIDHFVGFDHLLRLLVGQERTVHLYGPAGFAERVFHKLQAYQWNLVESYGSDLVFVVSELETPNSISTTQFRLKRAFAAEPPVSKTILDGVLCDERTCRVAAAILDHRMPCLGFALQDAFAGADAALARDRAHLTTTAAGEIAREANVRRVEPFHFSPRYAGEQERMMAEVMTAFSDLKPDVKT